MRLNIGLQPPKFHLVWQWKFGYSQPKKQMALYAKLFYWNFAFIQVELWAVGLSSLSEGQVG